MKQMDIRLDLTVTHSTGNHKVLIWQQYSWFPALFYCFIVEVGNLN